MKSFFLSTFLFSSVQKDTENSNKLLKYQDLTRRSIQYNYSNKLHNQSLDINSYTSHFYQSTCNQIFCGSTHFEDDITLFSDCFLGPSHTYSTSNFQYQKRMVKDWTYFSKQHYGEMREDFDKILSSSFDYSCLNIKKGKENIYDEIYIETSCSGLTPIWLSYKIENSFKANTEDLIPSKISTEFFLSTDPLMFLLYDNFSFISLPVGSEIYISSSGEIKWRKKNVCAQFYHDISNELLFSLSSSPPPSFSFNNQTQNLLTNFSKQFTTHLKKYLEKDSITSIDFFPFLSKNTYSMNLPTSLKKSSQLSSLFEQELNQRNNSKLQDELRSEIKRRLENEILGSWLHTNPLELSSFYLLDIVSSTSSIPFNFFFDYEDHLQLGFSLSTMESLLPNSLKDLFDLLLPISSRHDLNSDDEAPYSNEAQLMKNLGPYYIQKRREENRKNRKLEDITKDFEHYEVFFFDNDREFLVNQLLEVWKRCFHTNINDYTPRTNTYFSQQWYFSTTPSSSFSFTPYSPFTISFEQTICPMFYTKVSYFHSYFLTINYNMINRLIKSKDIIVIKKNISNSDSNRENLSAASNPILSPFFLLNKQDLSYQMQLFFKYVDYSEEKLSITLLNSVSLPFTYIFCENQLKCADLSLIKKSRSKDHLDKEEILYKPNFKNNNFFVDERGNFNYKVKYSLLNYSLSQLQYYLANNLIEEKLNVKTKREKKHIMEQEDQILNSLKKRMGLMDEEEIEYYDKIIPKDDAHIKSFFNNIQHFNLRTFYPYNVDFTPELIKKIQSMKNLERYTESYATKNEKIIYVVLVTKEIINFFINFLCSLEKVYGNAFSKLPLLVLSPDKEVHDLSTHYNFFSLDVLDEKFGGLLENFKTSDFTDESYQQLILQRTRLIAYLNVLGFSPVATDIDTIWKRNPLDSIALLLKFKVGEMKYLLQPNSDKSKVKLYSPYQFHSFYFPSSIVASSKYVLGSFSDKIFHSNTHLYFETSSSLSISTNFKTTNTSCDYIYYSLSKKILHHSYLNKYEFSQEELENESVIIYPSVSKSSFHLNSLKPTKSSEIFDVTIFRSLFFNIFSLNELTYSLEETIEKFLQTENNIQFFRPSFASISPIFHSGVYSLGSDSFTNNDFTIHGNKLMNQFDFLETNKFNAIFVQDGHHVCGCFVMLLRSQESFILWLKVLDFHENLLKNYSYNHKIQNEQSFLSNIVLMKFDLFPLHYWILPVDHFPSGINYFSSCNRVPSFNYEDYYKIFFNQYQNLSPLVSSTLSSKTSISVHASHFNGSEKFVNLNSKNVDIPLVIIHNNFIVGSSNKINRFIYHDMWFVDEKKYHYYLHNNNLNSDYKYNFCLPPLNSQVSNKISSNLISNSSTFVSSIASIYSIFSNQVSNQFMLLLKLSSPIYGDLYIEKSFYTFFINPTSNGDPNWARNLDSIYTSSKIDFNVDFPNSEIFYIIERQAAFDQLIISLEYNNFKFIYPSLAYYSKQSLENIFPPYLYINFQNFNISSPIYSAGLKAKTIFTPFHYYDYAHLSEELRFHHSHIDYNSNVYPKVLWKKEETPVHLSYDVLGIHPYRMIENMKEFLSGEYKESKFFLYLNSLSAANYYQDFTNEKRDEIDSLIPFRFNHGKSSVLKKTLERDTELLNFEDKLKRNLIKENIDTKIQQNKFISYIYTIRISSGCNTTSLNISLENLYNSYITFYNYRQHQFKRYSNIPGKPQAFTHHYHEHNYMDDSTSFPTDVHIYINEDCYDKKPLFDEIVILYKEKWKSFGSIFFKYVKNFDILISWNVNTQFLDLITSPSYSSSQFTLYSVIKTEDISHKPDAKVKFIGNGKKDSLTFHSHLKTNNEKKNSVQYSYHPLPDELHELSFYFASDLDFSPLFFINIDQQVHEYYLGIITDSSLKFEESISFQNDAQNLLKYQEDFLYEINRRSNILKNFNPSSINMTYEIFGSYYKGFQYDFNMKEFKDKPFNPPAQDPLSEFNTLVDVYPEEFFEWKKKVCNEGNKENIINLKETSRDEENEAENEIKHMHRHNIMDFSHYISHFAGLPLSFGIFFDSSDYNRMSRLNSNFNHNFDSPSLQYEPFPINSLLFPLPMASFNSFIGFYEKYELYKDNFQKKNLYTKIFKFKEWIKLYRNNSSITNDYPTSISSFSSSVSSSMKKFSTNLNNNSFNSTLFCSPYNKYFNYIDLSEVNGLIFNPLGHSLIYQESAYNHFKLDNKYKENIAQYLHHIFNTFFYITSYKFIESSNLGNLTMFKSKGLERINENEEENRKIYLKNLILFDKNIIFEMKLLSLYYFNYLKTLNATMRSDSYYILESFTQYVSTSSRSLSSLLLSSYNHNLIDFFVNNLTFHPQEVKINYQIHNLKQFFIYLIDFEKKYNISFFTLLDNLFQFTSFKYFSSTFSHLELKPLSPFKYLSFYTYDLFNYRHASTSVYGTFPNFDSLRSTSSVISLMQNRMKLNDDFSIFSTKNFSSLSSNYLTNLITIFDISLRPSTIFFFEFHPLIALLPPSVSSILISNNTFSGYCSKLQKKIDYYYMKYSSVSLPVSFACLEDRNNIQALFPDIIFLSVPSYLTIDEINNNTSSFSTYLLYFKEKISLFNLPPKCIVLEGSRTPGPMRFTFSEKITQDTSWYDQTLPLFSNTSYTLLFEFVSLKNNDYASVTSIYW